MSNFRDLDVWRESIRLAKLVYILCDRMPHEERYVLQAQMKRAVVSVASNIAEGSERSTARDFRQFLYRSRGSLGEVETQIVLSVELELVQPADVIDCDGKARQVHQLLNGLIRYLSSVIE